MENISFRNVDLADGYWKRRYELNRDVSVQAVLNRFEDSGRMDALRFNYDGTKELHFVYESDLENI